MSIQTISFDENLIKQIEVFKSKRNYSNNSQAIIELIRAGLEYLDEREEDEYLLALAEERLKNGSGKTYSMNEIMKRHGITQEDLDNAEEVEFE